MGAALAGRVGLGGDWDDLQHGPHFRAGNACDAFLGQGQGAAEAKHLAVKANGVGISALGAAFGNGAVGQGDGDGGHESRVGVEAFASCPFILHPSYPLSTLVFYNLQQIKAHPVLHPHQIPVAATDRVDKSEFSTIGQMLI